MQYPSRERSWGRKTPKRPANTEDSDEDSGSMVLQIQQMLAQKSGPVVSSAETLASSRKARRLYLGNLPTGMGLTDVQVTEFFNMACQESGIAIMPGLPVTDSWIAPEGKYGFVEFRSIDECTAGMALNGISLQGRQLVVKRPNDYEAAPDHIPTNVALTGSVNQTPQPQLNYGALNPTVGMPVPGIGMGALGGIMPGGMTSGFGTAPGGFAMAALAAPMEQITLVPSTVLVLANMVAPEELQNDDDFADIMLDTKEECEKFGKVVTIKIPRPSPDGSAVSGLGKIFVMFDSTAASLTAHEALDGRLFDARAVEGTFLDESKFLTGELA